MEIIEESLNTKELLEQGFKKYKTRLEKGDMAIIADKSGESLRNVRECISNFNVKSTATGLKIFRAMYELLIKRDNEVKKLVA